MDGHRTHKTSGHHAGVTDVIDLRPDAACKRLRECANQREACEVVREIVSNLLGCEEMALFEVDRNQGHLSLIWSFGIEPKAFHLPSVFKDEALPRVMAGEVYLQHDGVDAGHFSHGRKISAVVPIKFRGKIAGALALLRLLPQKAAIDELDRGVFAVLSREAGEPLFGGATSSPANRERNQ